MTSAGVGARINLFGYMVVEIDYLKAFALDNGWRWQFSAIPGGGAGGAGIYGIGYVGSPVISLPAGTSPVSLDITNTTYAYLSMRASSADHGRLFDCSPCFSRVLLR